MKTLTVGELRQFLKNVIPETAITFGSSKYTARPLVFYRCKQRGDDLVQIELNELEPGDLKTEQENRITARSLLQRLDGYRSSDLVEFGTTIDAVTLEFGSLSTVVAINLEQNEEPLYRVID